jgi:hypothetical protein
MKVRKLRIRDGQTLLVPCHTFSVRRLRARTPFLLGVLKTGRESELPARHAHMAGDGGLVAAAIDDEIVALGFAADCFVDGGL